MKNELPKLNKASWIRNFGRSVKYAVTESFNEHFPMAEAYKNQSPNEDLKFARKELRTGRKFLNFVSKTTGLDTFFGDVDLAYKNMKTSMKSGNFYNSRRARKAEKGMFEAFGVDSSELDDLEKFLKSDFNDESEESLEKEGNANDTSSLEKDLESGFNDTSQIISEAVTGSADYIAGSIKGAASASYATSLQTIRELKFGFNNLNSGIAAINMFNKEQMSAHIANTTKYFETTTNLLQEQNAMIKGLLEIQTNLYEAARKQSSGYNYDPLSNIIDPLSGALNIDQYISHVKENFEKASGMGNIIKLLKVKKDEIVQNPMHFLLKQSLSILGGDRIEKALDDMQKNIVNSLYTLNAKISRGGGGILSGFLSLLGIKEKTLNYANTTFEKGPMQYNGAANKSIVEVIPTYLARIEAALTGGPARFYDMERGTWTTAKEVRERWNKKSSNTGNSVQSFVKNAAEKIVNNEKLGTFTPEQQRDLRKMLAEDVIPALRSSNGVINKNKIFNKDRTLNSEFLNTVGLKGKNYDKDMIELVGLMFEQMNDSERRSLVSAARSDRYAKSQALNDIGNNPYDINNIIVNGALSGTMESKYHLDRHSLATVDNLDKKFGNGLLGSGDIVTKILNSIYDEVYDIHTLMEKGSGGYKKKYKGASGKSNRSRIDFRKMISDEQERLDYITDIDEEKATGVGDLFGGNVEIDFTGADETVQDFINFVRNDLLRVDSFKLYIPTHQNRLVDFCNVLYNVPFGPTGNTYFDDFVKELKKTPISEKEDIFTWVNDPDHAILIYKLIRAIKYREDPNKTQSRYSDNKDKTSAVRDALKGALYKSPTDKYNSFEGEGFFDKLSKARGFDKLDVITSKIKSLTEKPTNFLVKGVNTASSFLGNLISGEFGNALSDITSLFGGGRAFGGTIPGPWPKLYALSPGEKVIPAYKNPDNPNRRKSNPMLDAIKENLVINRAREAGVGVAGGFLTGTDSVPGDDSDDPFSNLFEKARSKFNDFKGLGEELFDKQLEDYLRQYITDNDLLKAAKEAIKARDLDKLKLVIASIPIKEAQQKIKESGETIWGKLGDMKDNIPSIIKMIPDSVRENIKDVAKYTGSGAVVGLASGLLGGPLGLVGGTLLGSAVGLMKHSEEAQNMFFGPGLGNSLKKFFGSNKKGTNLAAVGATVGGLVGGPFGAVGGLILGTGLNFVKSSEKFDEFMFGEKGLVTKMDNFFGETFKKTRKSIGDYIKEAITEPIDRAIIPVGTALQIGFKKSFELLEKGLRDFVRPKLFDFSKLIKKGVKGENKYLTGALGGAAGGAMVGGPFGAVVGGLVGSIAHGTGFDKKLVGIGKLPGKLLNSFSNRLAAWEISSGQGFNWSAQERINKMREIGGSKLEDYEKSNQFKIDTKLSQSNREDLIDAEMLIAAASGKNPEYKQALKEAIISIENALVTAGVDSSVINYITSKLAKDKKNTDHAKLFDELIQKQPNIPESAQKELASPNGDFAMGVKRYINILDFIEKYVDNPKAKENARKELQEKWNIGEDDFDKAKKNIRAEKDRKPLEKKNTIAYKATDAIIEYGKLLSTNISSGFERVSNYLHSYSYMFTHPKEKVVLDENGKIKSTSKVDEPNRTETKTTFGPLGERIVTTIKYADDGSVASETQEAFARDGRRIELDDVGKVDERTQEAREAEIKEEKDQEFKEELLENVKIIKDNGGGFSKFLKNLGKGAKGAAKGIFGGLKDIFNFIASPLKTMFGMFDSFMDSIPVIGDYWNAGKRMVRMKAKSIGRKAISWAGSKLNKAAGRVSGWMRGKSNTTGLFDGTKFSGMRDFSDYLEGNVRLYAGKDYKFMDLKDRTENLTKKEKKLLQKVMTDPNFIPNKQELDTLTKIQNTKVLNSEKTLHTIEDAKKRSLQYQAEDILTSRGTLAQDVDMKMRGIRNKYSSKNISNKISDMYLNAGMKWQDGTYYKKFGDKYLELADRLSNTKYGKGIADKMLSDNYLSRIDNLFGVKGTKLGNRMLNDRNLSRAANWATRLGTAGSKAVAFGTKALGGVAKFAGKWGGKILGGVLDVIDMMAIQNAMTDAASAVNPQDEMEALTIIAQNSAATSAAMPLLGEAIKNNNPNSGALGDLVMEGGKFALGKVGIGGAAAGAAGTGIGGTLAGIGSGITATAGGIYGAAKAGLLGAKTAVVSGAKSAGALAKAEAIGAKSSVVSFIKTVFEKVVSVAKKFLKPETVSKLGELMGKIITNVSKPGVLTKLAPAVAKKAVQIASGPIGWAIMAGFVAHSFYKGYDDAEKIWKPKDGEELTVFKKAMCGIANVLYNDCLLSIVFDMDQIIGFIKQLFQDPEDRVTKGIAGTDNADESNSILQKIKDASSKAWEGMTSDFNKGIGAVGGFVENIKSGIQNTFGGFIDKAKEFGNKVADAIDSLPFKNGIGGMIESALKPLKDLYNRIFGKSTDNDNKTIDTTATPVDVKMSEPTKFVNEIQVRSQMKGRRPRGDGGFGGFKFKLPSFKWGKGDGGNGGNNAELIWNYLASKGLGSTAIAGIMGNIQQESGFMPDRVQGAGVQTAPEITVDGNTGYGLCQWTYHTRQQALKDFAASRNKSSSDLETQLDFMLQEINQRDPNLLGRMANMSAHDAAVAFHDSYEGSADDRAGVSRRGDNAENILKTQGRGIITPGTYAASVGVGTTSTAATGGSSSNGGGLFASIGRMLENTALGKLGAALFGNAGFFTSGLFGGGSAGGAGSSRGSGSATAGGTPRGKGSPNDKGVLTEEPEEGQYWVRQTSSVRLKGCHVQALEVLDCLGKFFYERTGHKLVVTAGTNGKHAPGQYSHSAGWKLDVNDWYGPENLQGGWITEGAPFTTEFKTFGHENGLGMADEGDHIDIQFADGYDWQDGQYYGGWDKVHGGGSNTSTNGAMSAIDFMTKSLNGSITGKYMEDRDGGRHGGIDIGAMLGTPIKSPVNGEVTKIAYEPGGYGNYLQIKDSKGKYHLFAHLKETPKLELGNKITAGQNIGLVGSSGLSSGPHVHYQIDPESNKEGLKIGAHLDPNKYQIDEKVRSFVEEQNSVADFKRMQEMSLNEETDKASKGDGGFLDPLKDAIVANKAENYNAKLDAMIAILGSILEVIKLAAGNVGTNNNGNTANTAAINSAIPALAGAGMPKLTTTTPGKSIQSIIENMIKIATDNT